ncbi:MAG: hypothetical protein HQK96_17880 [Nitrospirae bacterium]|nr:hypothetical protein [Nitrospirota bacterium]
MTTPKISKKEGKACQPVPLSPEGFNPNTQIPFGLKIEHIRAAMQEFIDFLGFVNTALHSKQIPRLESFLMPANFSSMVGEFMNVAIPKYCPTVVKNSYHNGHPDLLPAGMYPNDALQHGKYGIEVKGSRYRSGWQGHNAEECWLMVFVFDSNTSRDALTNIPPRPFRFVAVYGAQLVKDDWNFSGRSETSRRTITASVTRSGFDKMVSNWIYRGENVDISPLSE